MRRQTYPVTIDSCLDMVTIRKTEILREEIDNAEKWVKEQKESLQKKLREIIERRFLYTYDYAQRNNWTKEQIKNSWNVYMRNLKEEAKEIFMNAYSTSTANNKKMQTTKKSIKY